MIRGPTARRSRMSPSKAFNSHHLRWNLSSCDWKDGGRRRRGSPGYNAGPHLAPMPKIGIIGPMSKSPRVTFKFNRIAEGDWQIEAHYPGAEIRYIRGFKTKAEIDEWLAGSLRIDWLRSQGYAK
jgi:hypothetical protein